MRARTPATLRVTAASRAAAYRDAAHGCCASTAAPARSGTAAPRRRPPIRWCREARSSPEEMHDTSAGGVPCVVGVRAEDVHALARDVADHAAEGAAQDGAAARHRRQG